MSKHTNDTASNLTLGVIIGAPLSPPPSYACGKTYALHYAETFVIPAAAGEYQLINEDHQSIQIIKPLKSR